MPFSASSRLSTRVAATVVIAAALLWPAIYNGFPLVFPDTSAYLQVALGHSWTIDRSGFYGLALKPASLIDPVAGLWIAVVIQCTIVAAVLAAVSSRLVRGFWPPALLCIAICFLTSLPWHAAQLMADAFTGVLILLAWLLTGHDLKEPGMPLLWLGAAVLMLFHLTHLIIFPAAVVAALIARMLARAPLASLGRNALALAACCAAVVAGQVTANGVTFNRWTLAPMGPYFLFARLHEDGLTDDWMDRHCGADASRELCALRNDMPRDSQSLLWGGAASPFDSRINGQRGAAGSWVWIDRMQQADTGSIREEPLRFAANVTRAGARQFMHFRALDDECPRSCDFRGLNRSVPKLGMTIASSRQMESELPKRLVQAVTSIVAYAALILMIPVLAVALRRRDSEIVSLALAILAGLCANALITGGLSDVHDRYQSRVIWLAPFAVLLALVRWSQRDSKKSAMGEIEQTADDSEQQHQRDRNAKPFFRRPLGQ